ncbi:MULTISPECIES: hypothetical protein [unclassified Arthrobacter]|uniref:hypothetical protein n=1 Tax=unclassified Arthrobacter TaxID=235627 RepID=UPI0033980DC6
MVPYRPVPPLTLGPGGGWKSVVAAVVMAGLPGTTATSAVAADLDFSVMAPVDSSGKP